MFLFQSLKTKTNLLFNNHNERKYKHIWKAAVRSQNHFGGHIKTCLELYYTYYIIFLLFDSPHKSYCYLNKRIYSRICESEI